MEKFAFFLKTYQHDHPGVKRLIRSFHEHNKDGIVLFLMCPKDDYDHFTEFSNDKVILLTEDQIEVPVFDQDHILKKGYLNQEIYKLSFWELGLCENYQCIDSDALFIRDFYIRDFMYDEDTPYTILIEDNDLKSDLYYSEAFWNGRREWISKIEDALDYHPYKLLTCHGFQIFSARALRNFKENYLVPNGYTYRDIIEKSPYEFSWYNLWLQKTECMPIRLSEPNFKTFHMPQQHINEVLRGMKTGDWAKGYIGIILNSNFSLSEYDDLSVYNAVNTGLNFSSVRRSYRFFRRMLYGRIWAWPKTVIKKACRMVKHG